MSSAVYLCYSAFSLSFWNLRYRLWNDVVDCGPPARTANPADEIIDIENENGCIAKDELIASESRMPKLPTVKDIRRALTSLPRTSDNEIFEDKELLACEDDGIGSPDTPLYLYWFSCSDLVCLLTHYNCEEDTEIVCEETLRSDVQEAGTFRQRWAGGAIKSLIFVGGRHCAVAFNMRNKEAKQAVINFGWGNGEKSQEAKMCRK